VKIPVMRRDDKKRPRATKTSDAELDALIEEATVDPYDESEQMIGFRIMLDENLEMPFKTEVLGVELTVETLDLTDDRRSSAPCTGMQALNSYELGCCHSSQNEHDKVNRTLINDLPTRGLRLE
jgi:hypothetical protein